MNLKMSADDARVAYIKKFGSPPDFQWYDGDDNKFRAMIEKAIETGEPMPDYLEAHGINLDEVIP